MDADRSQMGRDIRSFCIVAYNFLSGGSRNRSGHWSRVARNLAADVVLGQECRPPEDSAGERLRPNAGDGFVWQQAGSNRWGSGILVKGQRPRPLCIPRHAGWVVGAEVNRPGWGCGRPVRLFSIHGHVGEHGYIRTLHEILDDIAPYGEGSDLVLGGDFNVAAGYRHPNEKRKVTRGEQELLDRLGTEFGLFSCWQAANPGQPLAQTLRWTGARKVPYHCDGIFAPIGWRDRLQSSRVVRGSRWYKLSDHNPVIARFTVGATPEG